MPYSMLMAKRLRQSQADIHALALHSATARLAAKLLDLADAFGKVNDIGIEIQLTLNREQLGALVGTSRETTTRVLRQFEQDQVVQLDGPIGGSKQVEPKGVPTSAPPSDFPFGAR